MDENRLEFEQQQEIVLTYRPAPQAREVVLRCERERSNVPMIFKIKTKTLI